MKLPDIVRKIFHKQQHREKVFLSLLLEKEYVEAGVWSIGQNHEVDIKYFETESVTSDTWEERTQSCDRAIVSLEQKLPDTELREVVLGLPPEYLTQEGEVDHRERHAIKELTKELDLMPIGFVPLTQAMIHKLRIDEGVPPSVILVHVTITTVSVFLYKIGTLIGIKKAPYNPDVSLVIEGILKEFTEMEVLPSRMLLLGSRNLLEEAKNTLLKHPWPTRANFMHFPKIEVVSVSAHIKSICLAGASEMAAMIGDDEETKNQEPITKNQDEEIINYQDNKEIEEVKEGKIEEELSKEEEGEEESNVVVVEPETLGFKKNVDVLEEDFQTKAPQVKSKFSLSPLAIPHIQLPDFSSFHFRVPHISLGGSSKLPILLGGIIAIAIMIFIYMWFIPHTSVTILATPQFVDQVTAVSVDPSLSAVDAAVQSIPGKKQEQSVSGEKTIPVSGTKQVGDPAKGQVTIYNKSLTSITFHKGDMLGVGVVKFTLDSDVDVASASESIGSITFGKANSPVTATTIGQQGNLAAGNEFTFQNTSSSVAIARNDAAFSGGTSKDVTVVSRADYDALVKALTDDLVTKAKENLNSGVSGGEKLITETIKSVVTQKTFSAELNQEAKEVHGNVMISVSGISYAQKDLFSVFNSLVSAKTPQGYTFSEQQSTVDVVSAQLKKDGSIALSVKFHGAFIPVFSTSVLQKNLAGKTLTSAQNYLRGVIGVGGAEFRFSWSLSKSRLPINKNNISVTVSLQN